MMHREGYTGKKASSNVPHSLIVWDRRANHSELPRRPRWRDIWAEYEAGRLDLGRLGCWPGRARRGGGGGSGERVPVCTLTE
jgi:hypothetical protein